jgi:flagellar hook-associated protein 1 FlgK
MRRQLAGLQDDADARLKAQVADADTIASQIADLNGKILVAEGGGAGQANGLRDQRDAALKRLSELVDVRTVADGGVVNVYLCSEPLVIGADNRGLAIKDSPVDGKMTLSVIIKATGGTVPVSSGRIGGLAAARAKLDDVIDQVDAQAGALIFELNKLHASGQGLEGFSSATAASQVAATNLALNDPASGLRFAPANGSFVVHVRNKATGFVTSTLVQVDLDGAGAETTLDSLRTDLSGISGVTASVSGGRLQVAAASGAVDVSFSQDSSGALSAIGLNTFYTGSDARDIGINQTLQSNPALLAAARNGESGDNQTARAIAGLEAQPLGTLGGTSLKDSYQSMVIQVGVATDTFRTEAEATRVVRETLESQREALSGVSLDEEAVNLMRQQRAFQGAARLVAAVDEMMKTILGIV